MHFIPGMPPAMDLFLLVMMTMASVTSLAAWRSPRTRGGESADVIRGIKACAWGVLGVWYTFRFIENDFDLKVTAITGFGLFCLSFGDILCAVIAMKRAQRHAEADPQTRGGALVHDRAA